eukprot:COSAG02_NODE_50908_length_317_cov_1.146789_1_plen_84_part_10
MCFVDIYVFVCDVDVLPLQVAAHEADYSDDEQEQAAKAAIKQRKRANASGTADDHAGGSRGRGAVGGRGRARGGWGGMQGRGGP